MLKRKKYILLVEDNPGDIELLRRALLDTQGEIEIKAISDGDEAIAYFESLIKDPTLAFPHLVILDLNLPRRDGRVILDFVKTNETLLHIPVVVLTSSEAQSDIMSCYQKRANAYIVKPMNVADLFTIGQVVNDFWLGLCRYPQVPSRPTSGAQ
jgi:two-component system, chemotaxis family, response regulator Rcp1